MLPVFVPGTPTTNCQLGILKDCLAQAGMSFQGIKISGRVCIIEATCSRKAARACVISVQRDHRLTFCTNPVCRKALCRLNCHFLISLIQVQPTLLPFLLPKEKTPMFSTFAACVLARHGDCGLNASDVNASSAGAALMNKKALQMFNFLKWKLSPQDPPPDSKATDSYFEKLVKLIPADIVAAYVAIAGLLSEHNNQPLWLTWSVFGGLLALTPLYVCYIKTDPPGLVSSKTFHCLTSCLAFTAWVFALGGPFATLKWYQPYLGSICLILVTLIIPVIEGGCYKNSPARKLP